MKNVILFIAISYIFLSCTENKSENNSIKTTGKECKDYQISDVPIKNIIGASSSNSLQNPQSLHGFSYDIS